MAKIARVVDTIVEEVQEEHEDGFTFQEMFPAETLALFISCPDDVDKGWSYDGTTWTEPPVLESLPAPEEEETS